MAKKKSSKGSRGKKMTVDVPPGLGKVDAKIIEGIVKLTLGEGPKFDIGEVVVQTSTRERGAEKDEVVILWDKVC